MILAECDLDSRERAYLELISQKYLLSGRGIMSVLAVARTIADMEESLTVTKDHLLEAVTFRLRNSVS